MSRQALRQAVDTGTSGQAPDWYADAILAALETSGWALVTVDSLAAALRQCLNVVPEYADEAAAEVIQAAKERA